RGHINNFSGQVAAQVQKDREKYGDVYVFKPNAVCVNNPADVRAILGSQDFRKADFFDVFDDGSIKNIVSQRDPVLASKRRRQIGPYLNYAYLNKMEPVIQRHGFQAIQAKWDRLLDGNDGKPTEVNYRIDTQLVTFDIMSALAFGRDPDTIGHGSSSVTKWSAIIMDLLDYTAILALLSLLPFSLIMRPWKSMYQELADYSKDAVSTRKDLLKTGAETPADMLQAFIEAEDPDSKVKMSPPEIQAECIMMMLAGSETTSSAIMWVFHLLLLYPDKLKKAVDEVRSAFDSNHLILHREVLSKLPFIEAVVYEALRVSPTTAGVTPRISQTRGIEIQGHYIPPATEIYVNLRSVNMSEDIWDKPERFEPERFINNDDAKKNLFTFSYGPRNCIGRNLAWVEMLTIVANVLKDYDIALAPGSPFCPENLGANGEPQLLPAKCFIASFPANAERDCRMLITKRK
ncbi:Cytochrome P450 monooxygenase helB1, partial [Arthroderma sp. PD_2]